VTITGVADNLSDGDQSYAILLSDNVSTDTRYQYVDPPDVTLKNLDLTDKGSFYVSAVSNDTDESAATATFTVRLSSQPAATKTVKVDVASSDTTEGTVSPAQLTFTDSDWNAEQTVTITGVADNLSDGDQSYAILLSDNVSTDTRYQYVDPPDVTLKNLDLTDKGSFYVSAVSNDTDESAATATFTVRLSSQPAATKTVKVDVASSDTTEGTVSPAQLTFTDSDWNAEQTVTITGVADNLSDGDQSYAILLSDNVSTDTRYQYVDPPDVTLKNLDLTDKGSFYVSAVSNDTDESAATRPSR